jgi:hypothetical protein
LVRKLSPSPTQSLAIKGSTPSVTRVAGPLSRHCRPISAHGESHLRPLFNANTCHSYLPLAPTKLPRSLVGHTGPPVRRSGASSGHRRRSPPSPPAGPLPAACKHTNRSIVTPRPSPATSPAKAADEVAGIRPTAPPPCPWTTLLTLTSFQGCNCELGV